MPMFDDPRKELRRLEEQLLAEEDYDELDGIEELLQDYEEEDFADCFQEETEDDEAFRRPDGHYTRTMSEILLEEEADADRAYYKEDHKKAKKQKGKGTAGLVILCVLEAAAIVGLLAWWYLCLR